MSNEYLIAFLLNLFYPIGAIILYLNLKKDRLMNTLLIFFTAFVGLFFGLIVYFIIQNFYSYLFIGELNKVPFAIYMYYLVTFFLDVYILKYWKKKGIMK